MKKIVAVLAITAGLCGCNSTSPDTEAPKENSIDETSENTMTGFYIGTYTQDESEGIYYSGLDSKTGKMTEPQLAVAMPNPSYLAFNSDSSKLLAVGENQDNGGIAAFRIREQNKLEKTNEISSMGLYPCYVSIKENIVMVANYGGGNVLSARLDNSGIFAGPKTYEHAGTGPVTSRQEAPHAHSILPVPDSDYALSADLGADKIYQYLIEKDGLTLVDSISVTPGAGPRHIDFHPRLKVMYVINELNSTIEVFTYELENKSFNRVQIISTIPDGYSGENYCADIHVHPDGNLLFGSNRGHGSIVGYMVDDSGLLELSGHFGENVNWPRNFAISPDGGFLVIANQRGESIITASIDRNSGQLTSTGHSIRVSQPSCILFE